MFLHQEIKQLALKLPFRLLTSPASSNFFRSLPRFKVKTYFLLSFLSLCVFLYLSPFFFLFLIAKKCFSFYFFFTSVCQRIDLAAWLLLSFVSLSPSLPKGHRATTLYEYLFCFGYFAAQSVSQPDFLFTTWSPLSRLPLAGRPCRLYLPVFTLSCSLSTDLSLTSILAVLEVKGYKRVAVSLLNILTSPFPSANGVQ